jgi:probable HAF family extracellular repeat protein
MVMQSFHHECCPLMESPMFKSSSSRPHTDGRRTGSWLALFACWLACMLMHGQALAGLAPDAIASLAPAPVQYRVINLVPGSPTQFPAINASGQVALSVADGDRFQSWFFDGRRLHAVAQPGWPDTDLTGLNDQGQVSGFSHAGYDAQHAFRWSLAGGFAPIGLDGESSHASAINRDGVVVFDAAGALDPPRALRWTAAGGREELGALDRWGSVPVALNDAGLVAGFSNNANIDPHAFAWTRASGIRDLGTLGGAAS